MRIKSVNFLIFIIVILLIGCTQNSTFKYQYKYFDNSIGQINNSNEDNVLIINNKDEALIFCNNNLNETFSTYISDYSDIFYESNYLVVIVLDDKTANNNYKLIKSYSNDDNILTIEIKEYEKKISVDSVINKAFIIEINNQERYSDIKALIK